MKTVEAIYERGVFRPLEPLTLPEGARVCVPLPEEVTEASSAPAEEEGDEVQGRMREFLAEFAALPPEGDGQLETAGRDHDHYLYGAPEVSTAMDGEAAALPSGCPGETAPSGEVQETPSPETWEGFAAAMREIAELPMEGKQDGFSGRDHDEMLYGRKRAR